MGKIFVTSDTHLGHNKEFLYAGRGFTSTEEHDYEILRRWNSVVSTDDVVYHLGDMMLSQENEARSIDIIKQLNGKIMWVYGNHDTQRKIDCILNECNNVTGLGLAYRMKYKKINIYMSHYPTVTINEIDPDEVRKQTMVYGLFGHTHQKDNFTSLGMNLYHVGVDSHDLYPVELDHVIKEIKSKLTF